MKNKIVSNKCITIRTPAIASFQKEQYILHSAKLCAGRGSLLMIIMSMDIMTS